MTPSPSHSNRSDDSLALFERSWDVYHRVVRHDLMEHRGLGAALEQALLDHLQCRAPGSPLHLADLACGDLTTLAPLLRRLPLTSFTAVDAAPSVLPRAAANLGPVGWPCHWQAQDLLHWAGVAGSQPDRYSVIICNFGLHHLADVDKWRFLAACRRCLADDGLLLIGDVFRLPAESRSTYLQRYGDRVRNDWGALAGDGQALVLAHIHSSDFPADRDEFEHEAVAAGWRLQWLWCGSHGAEALVGLRPASADPTRSDVAP